MPFPLREIRKFVAEHAPHDTLPTEATLRATGRGDLVSVIRKHGGFPAVAKRLGLTYTAGQNLSGYWNDFSNVGEALRQFCTDNKMIGLMPTERQLRAGGYGNLASAIRKYGGILAVAQRLGLSQPNSDKPPSYWDSLLIAALLLAACGGGAATPASTEAAVQLTTAPAGEAVEITYT
jgi:hypothetical protein